MGSRGNFRESFWEALIHQPNWFPAAVLTSSDCRTRRVSIEVTVRSNLAASGIANWAGWTC
jgi:hypothetical protein